MCRPVFGLSFFSTPPVCSSQAAPCTCGAERGEKSTCFQQGGRGKESSHEDWRGWPRALQRRCGARIPSGAVLRVSLFLGTKGEKSY